MAASAIYLDASALVKLILREQESEALTHFLTDYPIRISSIVGRVEVMRVVLRVHPTPSQFGQLQAILREVAFLALDEDLQEEAGRLAPPTLRSLDAIHLATALSIRHEIEAFVAYDKRLLEASTALGLRVVSPGA